MSALASTTCVIHEERPAAARCPSCERFFCSECITEHDGRLSCASCLAREHSGSEELLSEGEKISTARRAGPWVATAMQALLALVLCWSIYYSLARLLMLIPTNFHDGTLWEE